MTPNDFALAVMRYVVEENVEAYRDIFVNTPPEGASDPYWRRVLVLYNNLSPDQRSVILDIMRQVAVDTTSNILGVIDGVNVLEGASDEFALFHGRERLSGDLQSLFLVEDEKVTSAKD